MDIPIEPPGPPRPSREEMQILHDAERDYDAGWDHPRH